MTDKQQKLIQAKLDGFNSCYILLHELMKDFVSNPIIPQPTRETMRGFLDSMERDQEKVCREYLEGQISNLRKMN